MLVYGDLPVSFLLKDVLSDVRRLFLMKTMKICRSMLLETLMAFVNLPPQTYHPPQK